MGKRRKHRKKVLENKNKRIEYNQLQRNLVKYSTSDQIKQNLKYLNYYGLS